MNMLRSQWRAVSSSLDALVYTAVSRWLQPQFLGVLPARHPFSQSQVLYHLIFVLNIEFLARELCATADLEVL